MSEETKKAPEQKAKSPEKKTATFEKRHEAVQAFHHGRKGQAKRVSFEKGSHVEGLTDDELEAFKADGLVKEVFVEV